MQNIADPANARSLRPPVAEAYERKATHQGVGFGVDDVIDPVDTRHWLANGMRLSPVGARRAAAHRRLVTTAISA
jgi:hypothetical protein